MNASIPTTVGSYRIEGVIGKGGMGVVYEARDTATGRVVALKVVRDLDAVHVASLRREVLALRRLEHPGVVRIVDSGDSDGVPWYAMELLEGVTLRDRMDALWAARGPEASTATAAPTALSSTMPTEGEADGADLAEPDSGSRPRAAAGQLPWLLATMRQLCEALAFVHARGVVHRDLKPANILLRPDGRPVLLDFGIVAHVGDALGREALDTSSTRVTGTVGYMSPEQILGETVDARADLYALGCIFFECLTGRRLFASSQQRVSRQLHLDAAPPRPSQLATDVPPALDELVARLLAKAPRDRLGHADDVSVVLEALGAPPSDAPPQRTDYLYRPRFAGRRALLGRARDALQAAQTKRGGRIYVAGESGMGKTRFALEVAREATRLGFVVVTGEGVVGGPLHLWRGLFLAVADRARHGGPDEQARLLGARRPILAPYEAALAALPAPPGEPVPPPVAVADARRRLIRAVVDTLLAFAARCPTLLVLDDLNWADELSLAVIDALTPALERPGLVLLGTWRSDEQTQAVAAIVGAPGALNLALDALAADELGLVVADMLGLAQAPGNLTERLAQKAEGCPFVLAELLRMSVYERILQRDARGQWTVADKRTVGGVDDGHSADPFAALELPTSPLEVVARRLDRLDPAPRALLDFAAVVGREIPVALLVPAGPSEAARSDALRELVSQQLLEERPAGTYRFLQDRLRKAAYGRIAPDRRRTLHLEIAALLTPDAARATPPPYGALAHHYAQAGDVARAIDYLELAGEEAMAVYANRDVLRVFEEARALDSAQPTRVPTERRARWERHMGEACLSLGRAAESRAHFIEGNRLLGFATPESLAGWLGGVLSEASRQVAHRATDTLGGGLSSAHPEASRRYRDAAWNCQRIAETAFLSNNGPALAYHMLRALNFAERAGPSPELARALANVAVGAGFLPWPRMSEFYRSRAERVARETSDPMSALAVERQTARVRLGQGQFADATLLYRHLLEAYTQQGDPRRWIECATSLAHGLQFHGEHAASQGLFERVVATAIAIESPMFEAWGKTGLAIGCLDRGEFERASELLGACAESVTSDADRTTVILHVGLSAELAHRAGDASAAMRAVREALAMSRAAPSPSFVVLRSHVALVTTALDRWRTERHEATRAEWAQLASEASSALGRFSRVFRLARPDAALANGDLEALVAFDVLGSQRLFPRAFAALAKQRAHAAWMRALNEARRIGMPRPLAAARQRLGLDLS